MQIRVHSFFTSDQRNWQNSRAFDELVGLAKCARISSTARAIYQTLRIWSNAARLTNWSNALCIWPNAQIGQMRLTLLLIEAAN